ncbi:hypothetical protein BDV95DRAFT_508760 [Massariosphaeria phaeospora]|uniref:Ent-kaurene synthase n=1 Tax=Massariosphaeria phaeospora TaxID=100035 RepID=A0A7C8HY78_9PLEO|nr:hypothetical protein BDV95DRAFT_508760 [Massariosphaeria phaeospora]
MNASVWDEDAENYLRSVFEQKAIEGNRGGFPSAFPSTIFEISWVLDLLIESGFDKDDFLLADMRKLTLLLEKNLQAHKGIVGWAPGCLPDADDTAKTISALRLLGWNKEVEPMLKAFESDASFITYRGEPKYTKEIVKCANFLSQTWMHNNGPDKWHTSVQYPMMLIAEAFVLFLKHWGKGELDSEAVPAELIHQGIPRTLLDILARTMRMQHADGSWESKREVTAYAILTLAPLLSLPWVDFLKPEGIACMYRGKAYLENNRPKWREAERLWVEKTVYSSSNLSQAYCLAASKIVVPTSFMSQKVTDLLPPQLTKKMAKMSGFFANVSPFSDAPKWKLQLSLLQSAQYTIALKGNRYNIFPPFEKASDEKYQEYIPFSWIGCKDYLSTAISAETLWQMMLVSMFSFQIDAYMETVVWEQYRDRLPELKLFIRRLCSGIPEKRKRTDDGDIEGVSKKLPGLNGISNTLGNGTTNGASNGLAANGTLQDGQPLASNGHNGFLNGGNVETVLTKYVNFAMQHPKVVQSPPSLRAWLAQELQTFLLAHITHMEDCVELASSGGTAEGSFTWQKPRTTFFNWVRSTSADHTSCPYGFVFFLCLISQNGHDVITSVQQRYALEDACRHLATMCRQYNDFGSVVRDHDEKNLNSVNFPEFDLGAPQQGASAEEVVEKRKRDLLAIAQYERRGLNRAVGELEDCLDAKVLEKLRLFIQVTDFYGHIYVARDIGIRHAAQAKAVPA